MLLVAEPGNGTRYALHLSEDPHGGIVVCWPDQGWIGWASADTPGQLFQLPRGAGRLRISRVDMGAIAALVDEARGRFYST